MTGRSCSWDRSLALNQKRLFGPCHCLLSLPGAWPTLWRMDVTWSADGHELIYANGHDLYSAKTDGSQPRKLLTASGFPFGTRFSPDGRSIRFTVRDATNDISLWEATTDGTGLHQVFPGWTNPPTAGNGQWTADGAYYIFTHGDSSGFNIWAVPEGRK